MRADEIMKEWLCRYGKVPQGLSRCWEVQHGRIPVSTVTKAANEISGRESSAGTKVVIGLTLVTMALVSLTGILGDVSGIGHLGWSIATAIGMALAFIGVRQSLMADRITTEDDAFFLRLQELVTTRAICVSEWMNLSDDEYRKRAWDGLVEAAKIVEEGREVFGPQSPEVKSAERKFEELYELFKLYCLFPIDENPAQTYRRAYDQARAERATLGIPA